VAAAAAADSHCRVAGVTRSTDQRVRARVATRPTNALRQPQSSLFDYETIFCAIYASAHVRRRKKLKMWANAQRDGRLAEHRWRSLFNAQSLADAYYSSAVQ